MTPAKFLAVAAFGLSAAACSYSNTTTATAPVPAPMPAGTVLVTNTSQQACVDYGFTPGTASYDRCVRRDAEARAGGRVPAAYTQSALTADSQMACSSYGLTPGTMNYDRCVNREMDARRYVAVTTYTTPAPTVASTTYYSPTPGTTVYTTNAPVATTTYVPAATTPPAGVQAYRDEYGFRYDGQGNRVDARGNIISPQSVQP